MTLKEEIQIPNNGLKGEIEALLVKAYPDYLPLVAKELLSLFQSKVEEIIDSTPGFACTHSGAKSVIYYKELKDRLKEML